MGEGLPGAARYIAPPELPGELVEVFAGFVSPFAQGELQSRPVARRLRHLPRQDANQFTYFCAGRVAFLFRGQTVVNIFPRASIFDHAGAFQLGEMTRDPGLAHPENFLELGHGEFVFLEEKQKPKPGGIGQELEKING